MQPDTGCRWGGPSCLTCRLAMCVEDMCGGSGSDSSNWPRASLTTRGNRVRLRLLAISASAAIKWSKPACRYAVVPAGALGSRADPTPSLYFSPLSTRKLRYTARHNGGSAMMLFTDKSLVCATCGALFVVTAGAQAFSLSRGLTTELQRCPSCRTTRPLASPVSASGSTGSTCAPDEKVAGLLISTPHPDTRAGVRPASSVPS
jgi:hypothetical protein